MRTVSIVLMILVSLSGYVRGEVIPVEISMMETTAWTGERVKVKIELRAPGSFSGSAGFDLPEIPGTLFFKVGNPVVSSKEIDGESWFVQTHEFALFSQKSGTVTIPAFPVRFEAKEGFTGPAKPVVSETKPVSVEIRRPPGSEEIPFLVTTEKLQITETWDPKPGEGGKSKVGDVFRRTIVQRSSGLTGMALAPASTLAPEGVRVYEPRVETSDNTERGAFDGERRETLTYLLQKSGEVTLPALQFAWWNPKTETLDSKVLPEIVVSVEAAPASPLSESEASDRQLIFWILILGVALILLWKGKSIANFLAKLGRAVYPPEKRAARALRLACGRNDPVGTEIAWYDWLTEVGREFVPGEELRTEVLKLHRVLYGPVADDTWEGAVLWDALKGQRSSQARSVQLLQSSDLPPLNSPSGSNLSH